MKTLRLPLLLLGLLAVASPVRAQTTESSGDTIGWHTVQPGETLMAITQRYLGNSDAWRENWALNPEVADPHRLTPGQKLKVILTRKQRTAELALLSRKVEEKPYPEPWTSAKQGDQLRARDGVRTYERSSAVLRFDDGKRLLVSEQSVVFLRDAGSKLEGVERKALEIVEGQADVHAPKSASSSELEIIVGGARVNPKPSAEDAGNTRSRKDPAGVALVMVYGGVAEVKAAGETVPVDRGLGTVVPKDGPPGKPEVLLLAPRLLAPVEGFVLDHSNPVLSWDPVGKASAYVVEVCLDAECAQLVARRAGVTRSRYQVDDLLLGELYWRITAVSQSGLDGFPSATQRISIRSLFRRGPEPKKPTATPSPSPVTGND